MHSLNCPNNNTVLEIHNITTTKCNLTNNKINLIFLGVILNNPERKDTNTSEIKDITINLIKN